MTLAAVGTVGTLALVTAPPATGQPAPWWGGCAPWFPGVSRTSATCGATLIYGRAIPPPYAPKRVKATIAAANRIDRLPYVWGGGHARWWTRGYDCSGAVSYALHSGGLLGETMVSGELERWGVGGVGRWITVYANSGHVFMVVAGLRFDTRGDAPGVSGPRWHPDMAAARGFVARHPGGL